MSTKRIITEYDVEKSLDYLRDGARDLGMAKERAIKAGHMLRHTEALEFKMAEGSADLRRAHARTSERYKAAMCEDAEAAGELAKLQAMREAAAAIIDAWRTQESTLRAMKL